MSVSPLPLWITPAEDEPAHGILLRLAERNGILSPTLVPFLTGLTVSRLREGDGVRELASMIRCDFASFMASTPVADAHGHLVIRGERVGSKCDVKRSTRRLCPHCVARSPHHRFWFDLEFVTTCPMHGCGLISKCSCGRCLSWADVSITKCHHCPDGSVTQSDVVFGNSDVIDMDRWVLGRLGVGNRVTFPVLDKIPLKQAIDTIGQIGALDIGGYRQEWLEARDLEMPEAEVRARGFEILKTRRLDKVLDNVYDQFLASGDHTVARLHTAYGWFGHWFSFLRPDNYPTEISNVVLANAERKFDVTPKTFRLVPHAAHPVSCTL
jgi:hypothetical protein